jgi:surface antigen
MPEDRYGITGRVTQRKLRLAAKLNKRNRRLIALAGVPLMAIAGVAVPLALNHAHAGQASGPSRTLCTGWARCSRHGYSSYGYQAHQWRSYWRMSAGDECTNYAAYVESTVYHVPEPHFLLGNGGEWAATAAAHGVRVNHTPSVGAVAEWDASAFGMGPVGHVAVVEAVGAHDSYIYISQQHMGSVADQYEWVKIKAHQSSDEWQEWPSNFIHFRIPRRADFGYYSAKSGNVRLRYSQTSGPSNGKTHLGRGRLVPLAGDWRGGGIDRLGYYNPKYGTFHLFGVSRHGKPNRTFKFGPAHMVPLVGDWTGDGSDGIGYYNPHTGRFYLRQKLSSGPALVKFKFGPPNMHPLAGDWNGGRKDGVGYYNPRTGLFALRNGLRAGPAFRKFRFGPAHMTPLVGDWTGGRTDGVGYYDRWTGRFALRYHLSAGRPTVVARFGPPRATPLTGVWYGV